MRRQGRAQVIGADWNHEIAIRGKYQGTIRRIGIM